jgi:para-nitrobenzyl esterase
LAKDLFHRAITESGDALKPTDNRHLREVWYKQEPMEKQGERIAKELGFSDEADALVGLRALSADKLLEGSKATMGFAPGNKFNPVVDGWAIPDDIMTIFDEKKQNLVPVIAGSNADEATIFISKPPFDSIEAYQGYVKNLYGEFADNALQIYPVNDPSEIRMAMCGIVRDLYFAAGARRLVREMAKAGEKSYLYHFTMTYPGPWSKVGAFHGAEMRLVFNNMYKTKIPFEDKHRALAKAMGSYWIQFAATGKPNKPGMVEWPAYDPKTEPFIDLGEVIKVDHGLRKEALDLADKVVLGQRKNR